MPITLIESNPKFVKERNGDKIQNLEISELFCNTVQGEGINVGVPSTFLRLKDCTLDCVWCDTAAVWKFGNYYTHNEVFELFEKNNMINEFKNGQHLILTGGSPLKQQLSLIEFINQFKSKYDFKPFIEVENEVVLRPNTELISLVDCWNNSPKLSNSGMALNKRWKPELLLLMNNLEDSWFKFVVSTDEEWEEIKRDFLPYVSQSKIILMPKGENQIELAQNREIVAEMAVKHGVRMTDRMHITIWDKKTGV